MLPELNARQIEILSGYFIDISKILFASTVVGFFVPTGVGPISLFVFFGGFAAAIVFLIFGLHLHKNI